MLTASSIRAVPIRIRGLLRRLSGPRLQGRLEGISQGQIHGWVWTGRSTERLQVRLTDDSGFALEVRADRYRADLAAAGRGDGHYGFAAPVSAFRSGRLVRACVASTGIELPNGPLRLDGLPSSTTGRIGPILFQIDPRAGSDRVTGWAVDRDDPARRVRVGLRIAGTVRVEERAVRYRTDVADGHDALHGFVLTHPGLIAKGAAVVALDSGVTLLRLRGRA